MKTFWIVLLVCVVGAAAFVLGQRTRPVAEAPAVATPAPAPAAAAGPGDDEVSKLPSSQPVRTFRGPDGLPHMIVYDPANPPDNTDPAQVRAAVLEDMKNHPRNIERAYDLTEAQIAEIVEGKRAFPEAMLPKPATTPAR